MAKIIYVSLDIEGKPAVRVDPIILGKKIMKWRRESGSVGFKFNSISDLPADFEVKKVSNKKINVINKAGEGDFEYTISVKFNGVIHTTTVQPEVGPPGPGDKPVIRN